MPYIDPSLVSNHRAYRPEQRYEDGSHKYKFRSVNGQTVRVVRNSDRQFALHSIPRLGISASTVRVDGVPIDVDGEIAVGAASVVHDAEVRPYGEIRIRSLEHAPHNNGVAAGTDQAPTQTEKLRTR